MRIEGASGEVNRRGGREKGRRIIAMSTLSVVVQSCHIWSVRSQICGAQLRLCMYLCVCPAGLVFLRLCIGPGNVLVDPHQKRNKNNTNNKRESSVLERS